ncbi:MAG: hypothetical protein J5798_04050 [Spirochaetaceae bacterium]|nr:hypothetical protein [Spirochaetaceae bacterium]
MKNESNSEQQDNTIFEFHQSYTSLDEDYQNHITITNDGELFTRQVQTLCYEPDAVEKIRFPNEEFANSIKSILEKYRLQANNINGLDWNEYNIFQIKLGSKKFSSNLYYLPKFVPELMKDIKDVIDYYHGKVIDWSYVFTSDECKSLR